jgi:hypothetical protein
MLADESDEEVAAKVEEGAVLLGTLTPKEWGRVVQAEKRGELLEVANRDGWEGVVRFIELLKKGGRGSG